MFETGRATPGAYTEIAGARVRDEGREFEANRRVLLEIQGPSAAPSIAGIHEGHGQPVSISNRIQSVTLTSLFGTATQLARALEQIDSKESELQHLQHELEQLQLSHALAASRLAEMERQVEEGRMREGDFIAHEKEHELALAAAKASALSLSLSLPSGTTPKTADVPQGIPFDFELSGAHKLDPPPRPPRIRTPPTYDECEVI